MRHSLSRLLPLLTSPAVALTVDLEIRVADELGYPVADAWVRVDWVPVVSPDPWNNPSLVRPAEARTDVAGRARLSGKQAAPRLVVEAGAEGHYAVSRVLMSRDQVVRLSLPVRGPAVRHRRLEVLTASLPEDGQPKPFDLELGAFLPPLGVGRQADILLSGRRESALLAKDSRAPYKDWVEMRFVAAGSGWVATPRPGQPGFAAAHEGGVPGLRIRDLPHPREAPASGYSPGLSYVEARLAEAPPPGDLRWLRPDPAFVPGPGRLGAPQWIFRIRPGPASLHGVLTDFGWLPDGRLRLAYLLSDEPGNPSLEFGFPPEDMGR